MNVPPTPGPSATPMLVCVSFTGTEPGQPERLHSRIVPAAGSVSAVSVMPFTAARIGLNRPGAPFGPASAGLIRTPLNWISSIPMPGVVAVTVWLILANARVSVSVFSELPPVPWFAVATPVPEADTSLITPLCENLIACVPENSSLSARAGEPRRASAIANPASPANRSAVPMAPLCAWNCSNSMELFRPGSPDMAIYEPIESRGPRRRYRLRSPVDCEPIGELECMTQSDVAAALERARKAQPAWAAVPIKERAALLRPVLARVLEDQQRTRRTVMR